MTAADPRAALTAAGDPQTAAATILVIDDDAPMRQILAMTLDLLNYLVLEAESGEQAVAVARAHPEIRLILLDVVMTGLSGNDLAKELEALLPGVAILFCSGHPASSIAKRYGIDTSAGNFLQKPLRLLPLQEKLEELLAPQ